VENSLYTPKVESLMYQAKARLPKDFPLVTIEREILGSMVPDTIVIQVQPQHFDWRTVEDKLDIAITLERLKELIRKEGVSCLIEKWQPSLQ
jgi:hypothetical protein